MTVLVTGATGFVGRCLLPRLEGTGFPVRVLLRPGPKSPTLPRGLPVEVALASLGDTRGLRAAMVGVETVIHLASAEREGQPERLFAVDVEGTRNLAAAAAEAGVRRLIYLSHLGADRASAYPLLRAKALAEDAIRASGVSHVILRCGPLFGPEDRFTTALAMALAISPGMFPLPTGGTTRLHPLWVEDLVTGLLWTLDDSLGLEETHAIGGPEFLSLREVVEVVMRAAGMWRLLVGVSPPYLRAMLWLAQRLLPRPPLTTFALDYVATNRTAPLDSMPQVLGLQPSRLESRIDYLQGKNWAWELLSQQFRRQRNAV